MELRRFFARCEDCAGVFVFPEASERPDLHPFFVGGQNVDPENRARPEAKVRRCPMYCFFPLGRIFHICGGGAHVDPKDSACFCVAPPRDEDVALRSVCEDKAPVQVGSEILPLLAGRLDNEEAIVFFDGNSRQGFFDAGGSLFVRKLAERTAVQGDFDACTPSGLHFRVEECLAEARVGAVGVFCQVATDGFADFSCLEVRNHFIVYLRAGCMPFWRGLDPGADVLPNAVCVFQDFRAVPTDGCAEIRRRFESKKAHKRFAVQNSGEILRVVDAVDAVPAASNQRSFENRQRPVQLFQRDFGNVAFRHKIPGDHFSRMELKPASFCLVGGVFFDSRDGRTDCAAFRFPFPHCVYDGCVGATFPQGPF